MFIILKKERSDNNPSQWKITALVVKIYIQKVKNRSIHFYTHIF